MFNILCALAFMAVSLAAALGIAAQHEKPKSFIYAVGLTAMLAQIVVLFAFLQAFGSPFGSTPPSTLASRGIVSAFSL